MAATGKMLAALLALVLSASLLAACGGDGGDSGTTPAEPTEPTGEALSAEQWGQEVSALSEEFNRAFSELGTEVAEPESADDYVATVRRIEELIGDHVSDLEDLEPPAELEDVQAEIVSTYEGLEDQFAEIADVVEDEGTPEEIQAAAERLQTETAQIDQRLADLVERAEQEGADISNLNQATG